MQGQSLQPDAHKVGAALRGEEIFIFKEVRESNSVVEAAGDDVVLIGRASFPFQDLRETPPAFS